ncbi:hypothetical protein [Nonomuraea sp. NPDC049158]|uniref:hypothetical protein n=1 Tax=Nonomuraea sp. NPDC049158 TaxID=3155649 RepID=UPI003410BB9A
MLWFPIALLPDAVETAFQLALWTAIDVLYLLVIRWRSRMLRAAAGVMFAVELAGMANVLLDELDLPELPILALIQPEQTAHLTYTGRSMGCYDRPSFGDLKPAERDAAFLCRARSRDGGVPPMFPDSVSDQAILAYGRALCRTKDRDEQKAILARAGSAWPARGADPWDLVYVCPEIVGATQPELLRSSMETEAEVAGVIGASRRLLCMPEPYELVTHEELDFGPCL